MVDDASFLQTAMDFTEILIKNAGRTVLHAFFIQDRLGEDLISDTGDADVGIAIADIEDPVIVYPETG